MNDINLRLQLAEITTELYHAGLITARGGNLSVRSVDVPGAIWITPSKIFKGRLHPDQMILIDFNGQKLQGDFQPSVESIYHAGVMRLRSEVNSVVHSHAPLSIVFGMTEMNMLPITTEAVFLSNYPNVPFFLGGTNELAQAVMDCVGRTNVGGAFLRNHGLMTVGNDLRQAADATLMVEHTVKILLACKMAGLTPSTLPEDTLRRLFQYIGVV